MYPVLISLYGPFNIYSYSTAIALGMALFFYFAHKHPLRKTHITTTDFVNLVVESALVAILGGRLLHVLSEYNYYYTHPTLIPALWNGGLSVLGSVIAVLIYVPYYTRKHAINLLPILDLAALYAPLLQAVARVGCFLAGCCYGKATCLPWGIVYTHAQAFAPLQVKVHPTQLYSSLVFLIILVIMHQISKNVKLNPGQLAALYLMLASCERLGLDFLRGDRVLVSFLSFHQYIALGLFFVGLSVFIAQALRAHKHEPV